MLLLKNSDNTGREIFINSIKKYTKATQPNNTTDFPVCLSINKTLINWCFNIV